MNKLAILIVAGFALMVIDGDKPAYRRATFDTFADCVAAGQSQIDSQRSTSPNITWQCIGE